MTDPLIPRADLFGNPDRLAGTISPDGSTLAWVAPLDGVLNIWAAPIEDPNRGHSLTHDSGRGISIYFWAYDGHHLLYLQDNDGDENWRLHTVEVATAVSRPLTPAGIRADIAATSRRRRGEVLVTLNERDPRYPDLFRLDIATGQRTLVAENPGYAGFITDDDFVPRLALRPTEDGGQWLLRPTAAGAWEDWLEIPVEDAFATGPIHLNAAGTVLYMRDSRGRDTAALTRIDVATGHSTILAEDPRADIGGVLADPDTHAPVACAVTVERASYQALDPRLQPDLDFLASRDIGDWQVTSRTEDDRRWIVSANSDIRPFHRLPLRPRCPRP